LAFTTSSMTLAVTSRAFEAFHSERDRLFGRNIDNRLLNLISSSKFFVNADTSSTLLHAFPYLPLLGFIHG
jgi:hypothetical protein